MTSVYGIMRLALAATVALLLVASQAPFWLPGAYLGVGISVIFGGFLVAGWPKSLYHRPLAGVLIDVLAITLLVASTGGKGSLFSPLYFLAALGLVRVRGVAWMLTGAVALVLGYVSGVVVPERSFEPLLSSTVAFEAGLVALFCVVAAFRGACMRGVREKEQVRASALAGERRYAEEVDSIASRVGPLLSILSVEERLRWTVETVLEILNVPYAHATTPDGALHQTAARGDRDAYPSWWHPEIQRLVLWSCRTGEIAHSDAEIHHMKGFLAVPLVAENGESVGVVVAGGRRFDAGDERVLRLLATPVTSALVNAGEAPGGLDPVSRVPNQDSLDRVLNQDLVRDKPLALMVVGLERSGQSAGDLGFAAKDSTLRMLGHRLKEANLQIFRCADGTFAVLHREADTQKVRTLALKVRRIAEEVTGPSLSAVSGFVVAERGEGEPGSLLDAARAALREARGRPERVYGADAADSRSVGAPDNPGIEDRTAQIVRTLEEIIWVHSPDLGEHSRAVSKISCLIGARMALSAEELDTLVIGGLLHDLGKIGLPDSIVNKPATLSAEEYEIVKQHPVLGARILDSIPELSSVVPLVRHHHERFDGGGYPEGLRGEDSPFAARIILVADAFDSMTRGRIYRTGRDVDSALKEIARNSGTQFDPEIVEALQEIMAEPDGWQASL